MKGAQKVGMEGLETVDKRTLEATKAVLFQGFAGRLTTIFCL